MHHLKAKAAQAVLPYLEHHRIIGVGTGSTVQYFIEQLAQIKHQIQGCVASSRATEQALIAQGMTIIDLNDVDQLSIYVDSADEVNYACEMIKGGGGALTGEKIVACAAKKFICIVDETKVVNTLGCFPVAVEVIPAAQRQVTAELIKLGGKPVYRQGVLTDHNNFILDVYHLDITTPRRLEKTIKSITGVIDSGLFACRKADLVIVAKKHTIDIFS